MSEPIIYTSYRDDDDEEVVSYQRMEQEGEEALARYREEKEKEAEELLKKYREQRAEGMKKREQQRIEAEKQNQQASERQKQEKQLSEKPKPKKSKIRRFLFKFKNEGILSALWYILMVVWFGFVGRTIIVSDLHIIIKILMIIGGLWWMFYVVCQHYFNTENED